MFALISFLKQVWFDKHAVRKKQELEDKITSFN